jgi:AP-2 complex subunit alpha
MKTEYHGPKGKIVLLYGNKSGSAIGQTRLEIQSISEVQIEKSVVAPLITPGSQIQQFLSVSCLSSFDSVIPASFYFEFEKKPYRFNFNLPIVLHKFVFPLAIQGGPQFFQKWNAIDKANEKMEIIKLGRPLPDVSQVKYLFSTAFGLSILDGIDSNSQNLVCAGSFYSSDSTAGVLLRLEANPNSQAYRLTVKSTDKIVSSAMFTAISNQLLK